MAVQGSGIGGGTLDHETNRRRHYALRNCWNLVGPWAVSGRFAGNVSVPSRAGGSVDPTELHREWIESSNAVEVPMGSLGKIWVMAVRW
jgi:hypothetical protein